jgi:hypothetical protein
MLPHSERCKDCKKVIHRILRCIDPEVREQHDLRLPARLREYACYPCFDTLRMIHQKLQDFRGYTDFTRSANLPKVDYYLPTHRLIVEFDESQHFTRPRAIALGLYPADLTLGYNRDRWIQLSDQLHQKDNSPAYRDEQRAWYDTLRDFSALILGNPPTIRLYARDERWCGLDPDHPNTANMFRRKYLVNR